METIKAIIKKGEWLLDALKRIGCDMIPTNTILDKTLTGIGATSCEIEAKRNSIIIEPNVPVILGKLNGNENLEAVYEKCTPYAIKKYLNDNRIKYKKILTTPESFKKIREAAKVLNINIYKDFFCLFDECEKVTQDIDYRSKIAQPIYDLFQFEGKAFVSATPLQMSHKEFERQKFQKIKIAPDYDYKKDLQLIVTNNFVRDLRNKLEELKDSQCVCIFVNKTDAINAIIDKLGLKDYNIFCSEKSVKKLAKRGIHNAYSQITYPFAKYNFFTCRFYSGLDIVLRKCKPDIIMLTDLNSASWTMIDPFTEAIQIQGRFRKWKKDDDVTYNSLTHISNVNPNMKVRSKEELDKRINQFISNYNTFEGQHNQEVDDIRKEAIFDDMKGLHCQDLIDEQGEINPFSIDNLYNEERVKSYYVSAQALYQAYKETGGFNVSFQDLIEGLGNDDKLRLDKIKIRKEKWKVIVGYLEKSNNDFSQNIINEKDRDYYNNILRSQDDGPYIVDAYMKIGKAGIEKALYKKKLIDKAIQQYDKEQAESLSISPDVLKDIKEEFEMNVYINKNEIKNRLQALYDEHNIKCKVTQETITKYYDANNSNSINGGSYKLTAFKFDLVDFSD